MSEADNTFLTPFASNIVKELWTNENLNYYSKKFVGPYIAELQCRIKNIQTAMLDAAIQLNKDLKQQENENYVNSEDGELFVYISQSELKLEKALEHLSDLHKLCIEIENTIHNTADSEYLRVSVLEERV